MNRPLRIIVIIGGIAIIALGIILFFLSKKTNYEVEKGLNEMFASLADNIEVSDGIIDKMRYEPFECSGIISYTCKSSNVTFKLNGIRNIKFNDVALEMSGMSNKKHVTFKVDTKIDYTDSNSKDEAKILALLPKELQFVPLKDMLASFSEILPTKISCKQEYEYDDSKDSIRDVLIDSNCTLSSEIYNINVDFENMLSADIKNPHVLGAVYEIISAIANVSTESLSTDNISHVIKHINISMDSKKELKEYLQSKESLSNQQRETIINTIKTLNALGHVAILAAKTNEATKHHLSTMLSNVNSVIIENTPNFQIKISPKGESRVDSMSDFIMLVNSGLVEWVDYLNTNYNIEYFANNKPLLPIKEEEIDKQNTADEVMQNENRDDNSLDNTSTTQESYEDNNEKTPNDEDKNTDSKNNNEKVDSTDDNKDSNTDKTMQSGNKDSEDMGVGGEFL